ncbi:MAG: CapA family protein [Phaeodactylibacter sp.]|nr:CapA family protein [Phaeodactylibacter sp.]
MPTDSTLLTLFLCGDVMTGRGIDQALPHSVDPILYESYIKDARAYLQLAEEQNDPIPSPISFDYIWGDALKELEKRQPALRIINLETAATGSGHYWPGKAVHYRMHPQNAACLAAAGIDGCALGNNHVLDWGYKGLTETLETLDSLGIKTAGAGQDAAAAARPAAWKLKDSSRVLLISMASRYSGVPGTWAAKEAKPGVHFLDDLSGQSIREIKAQIDSLKGPNDVVIFSIHWGGNWGYEIPPAHREFAHRLIDEAGVGLIHGHSSHHFKGIEVYNGRLILYGCGDFINDYEGIGGHEEYRGELALMYFPTVNPADGRLARLEMVPMIIRNFRLNRASREDARWIEERLNREGAELGTRARLTEEGVLQLEW